MLVPVDLGTVRVGDSVVVHYHKHPGRTGEKPVYCQGKLTSRGVSKFRSLDVPYIKVDGHSVLVDSIVRVELWQPSPANPPRDGAGNVGVAAGVAAANGSAEPVFFCVLRDLSADQQSKLAEFSLRIEREPARQATWLWVAGEDGVEMMRRAMERIGVEMPQFEKWWRPVG